MLKSHFVPPCSVHIAPAINQFEFCFGLSHNFVHSIENLFVSISNKASFIQLTYSLLPHNYLKCRILPSDQNKITLNELKTLVVLRKKKTKREKEEFLLISLSYHSTPLHISIGDKWSNKFKEQERALDKKKGFKFHCFRFMLLVRWNDDNLNSSLEIHINWVCKLYSQQLVDFECIVSCRSNFIRWTTLKWLDADEFLLR